MHFTVIHPASLARSLARSIVRFVINAIFLCFNNRCLPNSSGRIVGCEIVVISKSMLFLHHHAVAHLASACHHRSYAHYNYPSKLNRFSIFRSQSYLIFFSFVFTHTHARIEQCNAIANGSIDLTRVKCLVALLRQRKRNEASAKPFSQSILRMECLFFFLGQNC